ncbi:hypothetical protein JRO89_XS01G0307700 [Xanthoceras sorbifolium]|uniref:Retrotransposon Copia-like N-terminal domain-containing protein n=1 Tax=Xanthoceras sorbifolium TaxID=99658 RepID=A0ABQ8INF6_9ROSI|nr:hypothetical protein JRO89_XS01G0307700 [Xanthoceras sorbifolium]
MYSLHPSDNPGTVLVSSLLNGDNYTMWSRAMLKALSAKKKSGFVDGTIIKLSIMDPNFGDWKHYDDMMASWIVNAIIPELASHAIYAETARDLWLDLKERFSQVNGLRIFELQQKINFILQGIALNVVHSFHPTSWIIDSEATGHMVSSASFLSHITSTC